MANNSLIIDDEYCKDMGNYFDKQGVAFDKLISRYVEILQTLRTNGVKDGAFAEALDTYNSYATKLKDQIGKVSSTADQQAQDFITQVDEADQYLF